MRRMAVSPDALSDAKQADDAGAYFLLADFDLIERPSRNDLFRTKSGVRFIAFTICSRVFPDPASSDRRRSSLNDQPFRTTLLFPFAINPTSRALTL